MAKRDYYEVLGVSRGAGADEIRRAHRKLVRQVHPDANKSDPRAEEKFKEIQEAYDVLSDAQKRKAYDQHGHAAFSPEAQEHARRAAAGRGQRWQPAPNVSVEDFDFSGPGGEGLRDIFDQFFGPRGRSAPRPRRGRQPEPEPRSADIEYHATVSFEQAARGSKMLLQITRDSRLQTVEVKIPAGVKEGSRIRLSGMGNQGPGEPGDLYVVIHVTPHERFRREDLDVYLDLPISLYEAMLGAKIDVPTLDGTVTLSIAPGTSSGAKLRISNRGIERAGQRGHQYVVTKIIVPKSIGAEEQRFLEQMQRRHPVDARAEW